MGVSPSVLEEASKRRCKSVKYSQHGDNRWLPACFSPINFGLQAIRIHLITSNLTTERVNCNDQISISQTIFSSIFWRGQAGRLESGNNCSCTGSWCSPSRRKFGNSIFMTDLGAVARNYVISTTDRSLLAMYCSCASLSAVFCCFRQTDSQLVLIPTYQVKWRLILTIVHGWSGDSDVQRHETGI